MRGYIIYLLKSTFIVCIVLIGTSCKSRCDSSSAVKIVGGDVVVSPNDAIYRSTLRFINNGLCTATLIGNNQAVTAAHCFLKGFASNASLGYGVSGEKSLGKVIAYKIHEGFQSKPLINDIAILVFSRAVLPTSLSPVDITPKALPQNLGPLAIAGYGAVNEAEQGGGILRKTSTNIEFEDQGGRRIIQESGKGQGTCYGDSGGPIFVQGGDGLSLLGATSTGVDCDLGDGVYTDVRHYEGWMKCNFAALGYPLDSLEHDPSTTECQGEARQLVDPSILSQQLQNVKDNPPSFLYNLNYQGRSGCN